jgi:Bacterial extracellular solute-binding proteins, family 5 Middle
VYEVAPSGQTSIDPAVAYDTVSYEPLLNIYQTLVAYNGSSTSNFVPEVSTCVPGANDGVLSTPSVSCQAVYGQSLIVNSPSGSPEFFTFPIDPHAHFYDPATGASWQVYPSDVMFTLARTMGFADLPGAGVLNGWIQTQALTPFGSPTWDGGIHFPFNNTPQNILGSMLVNNSLYCPAAALAQSGCITFNANGGGAVWPFFLQLVADALGTGIEPCGWFTAQSAGVPGFPGSSAAHGDGPCLLPGSATSTNDTNFQNYVGTVSPTAWDSFEELAYSHPNVQTSVRFNAVGSGPYYLAAESPTTGYTLQASPGYQQPTGCVGVGGGCEPVASATGYMQKIVVTYEADDTEGIQQYVAGQADFATVLPPETSTLLQLQSQGKVGILYAPTISTFFMPYTMDFNTTGELAIDPQAGTLNVPHDFFGSNTVRNFLNHAWPYTTIQNTLWTIDGIQYNFNFGGAIPKGMGNYYPNNISWPYQGGDPGTNTSVNSAAWWWTHGTTSGDPNYDAELAACITTTCKFPIIGELGAPTLDSAIADFISSIKTITSSHIQPYTFDLSFPDLVAYSGSTPGNNPMPFYNLGWAPDYPDPTDYMAAMYYANGTYTLADSLYQSLEVLSQYNSASCGHPSTATSSTFADLTYWANYQTTAGVPIPSTCQGPAYGAMLYWMGVASSLAVGAYRTLIYNEVEHIENGLGLYLWFNQANTVASYAKWINPGGINVNIMIGGGGDQTWYTSSYATSVSTVTFTETGLAASTPWSVTYAGVPYTSTTSTITIAGQTAGSYSYDVGFVAGYTVSPSNGTATVAPPTALNIPVTFTPFSGGSATTFVESGLAAGVPWTIEIVSVGSITGNASEPSFTIPTGTYSYTVHAVVGYSSSPTNGSVVAGTTVGIVFTGLLFETFPVTLTPTGLGGASWTVVFHGFSNTSATGGSMVFWEPNGSYDFTVSTATLTPISPTGQASVVGAAKTIYVPFTAAAHTVTFTESGLATGVTWGVEFLNTSGTKIDFTATSAGTTVAFHVANGNYNWSVIRVSGWIPTANQSGNSTVSGAAVGVGVPFALVTYTVTVYQVGFLVGQTWKVNATFTYPGTSTLGYAQVSGHHATIALKLPNGTAALKGTPPAGYAIATGSVTVSAAATSAVLVFAIVPFLESVTFSQTGVTTGSSWSVSFNGITESGTGASLAFTAPNGTYTYAVTVPSGQTATPAGGTLKVSGPTGLSVTVKASSVTTYKNSTTNNIPSWAYAVIGVFVVLTLIFLVTTLMARRKPPMPPAQSWSPGQTTETKPGDTGTPPPSS